MEKARTFVVLDAFRGLAALIVVEYHLWPLFGRRWFPHGYLAVDFFFMLSGFVLTHAYQKRLDQGWKTRRFLETRMVRLYPLYLLAMVVSALLFGARLIRHSPQAQHPAVYASLLAAGVFFLPVPVAVTGYLTMIFPLNPPAWSLFYEVVINLAHALFGRRRSSAWLLSITAAAALVLTVMTLRFGSLDAGESPYQVGYALVRVVFAYTMGSLLSRAWPRLQAHLPSWPLPAAALLVATFLVPGDWHRALVDIATVLVVFPLLLLLGAAALPARWMIRPSVVLGQSSYGIYVLHVPCIALGEQIWSYLGRESVSADAPWSGVVLVSLTVGLVLLLDRVYDLPLRGWLKYRLERNRGANGGRAAVGVRVPAAAVPAAAVVAAPLIAGKGFRLAPAGESSPARSKFGFRMRRSAGGAERRTPHTGTSGA